MIEAISQFVLKLSLFLVTAVGTHLVMSFGQTLIHYKVAHHPIGGKIFRNHINLHHTHYSDAHLVSRKCSDSLNLWEFGKCRKAELAPFSPLATMLECSRGRGLLSMKRPGSPALHLAICTKVKRRMVVRILQPRLLMQRMSPASVHKNEIGRLVATFRVPQDSRLRQG